jgi:hypothetical protein
VLRFGTRPPTNLNLNLNYEKLRAFKLQNLCHLPDFVIV